MNYAFGAHLNEHTQQNKNMKNPEITPTIVGERTQETDNHGQTNPVPVLANEWSVTPDGLGINTGKGVFRSDHAPGIVQHYNGTRLRNVIMATLACIVCLSVSGCDQNEATAAFLIGIMGAQSGTEAATDEQRDAYAHKQAQEHWGKLGYVVDDYNMPIGYYKDYPDYCKPSKERQ